MNIDMRPVTIQLPELAQVARGKNVLVIGSSFAAARAHRVQLAAPLRHASKVHTIGIGSRINGCRYHVFVVGKLIDWDHGDLPYRDKWVREEVYTSIAGKGCHQLILQGGIAL